MEAQAEGGVVKRDWSQAEVKRRDRRCRVRYDCYGPVELAHVSGRRYDENGVVNPDDVVPLCQKHHMAYDAREFDLLPFLDLEEQSRAVLHLGIVRAYKRTTSGIGDEIS